MSRTLRTTLGLAVAAGLLATAGTAVADLAADPAITVRGLIGHGGACTSAKPKLIGVTDNVVAIGMPPMTVRVGPVPGGDHVARDAATCSLSFRVVAPSGYTFVLQKGTFRGSAQLTAEATGYAVINYLLPGQAGKYVTTRHPFTGPTTEPWSFTDELAPPPGKPQGESVSLDVELGAQAGASYAEPSSVQWTTDEEGATMRLLFGLRPARRV